ncbi:MAG TPA: TlpA disulfide reductase family protein [Patescibacteria group bacterium]|nr:TlpA disulfide reductase family protein [Patescibacteria group bacterium]
MLERLFGHKKAAGPGVGDAAPDFSLATLEGGRFTLSELLQTGPAVIAFFKVSCPTCQFTLPFLDRLHLAYQNDPVEIWAISQDNANKSRKFREQFGVSFPIALDGEQFPASKSCGFSNVPTILLIDRAGQILHRFSGFSRADLIRLSEEIAKLIGRPPAPVFLAGELVPEIKPG